MVRLAKHKRRMILFRFVHPSVKASFLQYTVQQLLYTTNVSPNFRLHIYRLELKI